MIYEDLWQSPIKNPRKPLYSEVQCECQSSSGEQEAEAKPSSSLTKETLFIKTIRVISKIENPQIVLLILLELPLGTLRYQKKFQLDI